MPFMGDRSTMTAPSTTARPATLWPPPRTQMSRPAARVPDGVRDVGGVLAPGDQRRAPVDEAVVDGTRRVVAVVAGLQEPPREHAAQLLEPLGARVCRSRHRSSL
jgi:hypothetical protein